MTKKIFIASDHAGFDLKKFVIDNFSLSNFELIDLGCDSSEISVDYPDYAQKLAKNLTSDSDFGILICGSGIGISIAANRFSHIRAALCCDKNSAKLSRNHNNANVLALGSRILDNDLALEIIKVFFESNFEQGRHSKRVNKLS